MMDDSSLRTVVDFLGDPTTYDLPPATPVDLIETHCAFVFLVGDRAYKLKKPVLFTYLDFTTADRRRSALEAELKLNRRTAPDLYVGVCPVRLIKGELQLGGEEGEVVDWVLEMRRFDPAAGLDHLADHGQLRPQLIDDLAAAIGRFHLEADVRTEMFGSEGFSRILRSNEGEFRAFEGAIYDATEIDELTGTALAEVERHRSLLERRRRDGWVRHCHGDLHLGNIVEIEGAPVLFDCIEFSDDIACIDVMYDLAFLLMDLEFRAQRDERLAGFAARALNTYLWHLPRPAAGAALQGLALLPIFMSSRAAVRSHVAARTSTDAQDASAEIALAQSYFNLAKDLLTPAEPRLIAIGGLSGTGKSTLARQISGSIEPVPGAVHLRSDVLRKQLEGIDLAERLPPSSYTPEAAAQVYAALFDDVRKALAAGRSVIVDAVFARADERRSIEAVAREVDIPFLGVWLEAASDVMALRVAERQVGERDASDATAEVVHAQLAYDLGEINWARIDASGPLEDTAARLLDICPLTSDRGLPSARA